MALINFSTAPIRDPIAEESPETEKLLITRPWIDWFTSLSTRVGETPQSLDAVQLRGQTGAIGITTIPLTDFGSGLYRICYYLRVTQPATTSSSLTISFGWVDEGIGCTYTAVPLTNNASNAVQSNTLLIRSDAPAVITYAVAYASVGAVSATYKLDITVEVMQT